MSVSLPADLVRELRERVGPRGLSAYLTHAVERELAIDRLADLVTWLDQRRGGPLPGEVLAEVEAQWPPA